MSLFADDQQADVLCRLKPGKRGIQCRLRCDAASQHFVGPVGGEVEGDGFAMPSGAHRAVFPRVQSTTDERHVAHPARARPARTPVLSAAANCVPSNTTAPTVSVPGASDSMRVMSTFLNPRSTAY